jgi:hypothetical protein
MDKNSLAGLVALTLIAAIVAVLAYCGKVSETSFLMVVSAIMGGVLQRYFPARVSNGNSVPPVGPAVGIVLAALGLGGGCASDTQAKQNTKTAAEVVEVTGDTCSSIASQFGRDDVEKACKAASGVAGVLELLLSEAQEDKNQPRAVSHDVCSCPCLDAGLIDSRK